MLRPQGPAPDDPGAAQVVLIDCTTQIAALGHWGIGPQQLGQARSARLLQMMHSTWSPESLTVNYLAMEVRSLQHPQCPGTGRGYRSAKTGTQALSCGLSRKRHRDSLLLHSSSRLPALGQQILIKCKTYHVMTSSACCRPAVHALHCRC